MIKYAQVGYRTPEAVKGWHETNMLNLSAEIGRKLSWSDYALACAGWVFTGWPEDTFPTLGSFQYLCTDGKIYINMADVPDSVKLVAYLEITDLDKYAGKDESHESGTFEVTT